MRKLVAAASALAMAALAGSSASAGTGALAPPTKDHGVFLNILPAGQGTTTTTADALQYELTGDPPPHDIDQLDMYQSLPVAKKLSNKTLSKYYKPETFLPPTGSDIEDTETPEPGLTILRDTFNVPHIYGDTRDAAMFGAGYVTAEDRLFMVDVLRHVGRGRLSEFLGASSANLAMDEASYQVAGYSETEYQAMIDRLHTEFGADGDQVIADGQAFVNGMNARITEDQQDPSKIPAEYPALQLQLQPWKETDIVAIAELIQAIFASGGGGELQNAIFLADAQKKLGKRKGGEIWQDLNEDEDPQAPVTADRKFPYLQLQAVKRKAVAVPDPSSVKQYQVVTDAAGQSGDVANYRGQSPLELLRRGLQRLGLTVPDAASNWLGVTAPHTRTHHPIAVMGPQVGYWSPEILMETDIHAPGLDARGATFPGISLYVLLGRGPDFAWSATSGQSNDVDVRAEQLCNTDGSPPTTASTAYVFNGQCTAMVTRTDSWFAKPSAGGTGPPDQVTAKVLRSVHGPVFATGTVRGKPVAFTIQRSTFGAELDSAVSFIYLNGDRVHNPQTFQQAMSYLTGSFNWLYVDSRHIAYYHSGLYPIPAIGVDPNLPSWGTGRWEWRGFVPPGDHPSVVDPKKGWIASWNNKPAKLWHAADSNWSYGPVYRVQLLTSQLRHDVPHGNMTRADMVDIMATAATQDLRGVEVLPWVLRAIGGGGKLHRYLRIMNAWVKSGAHRVDRNHDGEYDDQEAVALMDTWWPLLVHHAFDKQLGGLYDDAPMVIDDHPGPVGSAFIEGFYGYVQKTVQMAMGHHVRQPYQLLHCGNGTLKGCRQALLSSLRAAVKDLGKDTSLWDADEKTDAIDYSAVGLVDVPDMPWQNRPTFQQVVQVTSHR